MIKCSHVLRLDRTNNKIRPISVERDTYDKIFFLIMFKNGRSTQVAGGIELISYIFMLFLHRVTSKGQEISVKRREIFEHNKKQQQQQQAIH